MFSWSGFKNEKVFITIKPSLLNHEIAFLKLEILWLAVFYYDDWTFLLLPKKKKKKKREERKTVLDSVPSSQENCSSISA